MKTARAIAIFILAIIATTLPETACAGFPIVKNFTRQAYHGGAQNWAVAQAPSGYMLFANSDGLLTYNSISWTLRGIDNSTTLRSILVDDRARRVYVGASNDFGFFAPDADNSNMRYHSLRNTIQSPDIEFGEIWNIHRIDEMVWFQGDFKLFCYDGDKTMPLNIGKKITASAVINGRLYIGCVDGTVGYINGTEVVYIKGTEVMGGDRVCAILPYSPDNIMIVTSFKGLFLYDGHNVIDYYTPLDLFLRDNQVFCATMSERKMVFGTVNRGAVIYDTETSTATFINKDNGLDNNTVLSAGFDSYGNLWLGLDNGLAFVMTNAPVTRLLDNSASFGAGYASFYDGGRLYFGTNQGLYSSLYEPQRGISSATTDVRTELKGQVWDIDTIGSTIFVSGDAGLYYRNPGGNFNRVEGISGAWSVIPLRHYPGHALASTYENFYILSSDGAGAWHVDGKIAGYNDVGGRPVEDANGDIWISQWIKGVYRLKPARDYKTFDKVFLYDSTHGFVSDRNNRVAALGDKLFFIGEDGFYTFNAETDSMERDLRLNETIGIDGTGRIFLNGTEELWAITPTKTVVSEVGINGISRSDSLSFRSLSHLTIPGFEHFDFVDDNCLIVGSQEGFYSVDISRRVDSIPSPKVLITRVSASRDSLIYSDAIFPATPDSARIDIPYKLNSLIIEFVAPEYRMPDAITYSYILENYDKDWSPYSPNNSKEYTRLHEGNYTFRVRAFNVFTGITTETALIIHIRAPWYRSIWANIIYLIMLIIAAYYGYQLFQRSSRRAATRIENEKQHELDMIKREAHEESLRKDYEIARLKSEQLEHDIRHKSGELSNITMNVIRKNEILLDIAARLTKLQDSMSGTGQEKTIDDELDHIKQLIRENISHDDDWRNFTRNFDVVYENYMKRLVAKYPQLSSADQRLCAYIKMGLSSKEIAPLLNISYRSVEMTRYRLRKKMNLPREVNLAEYLRNF